MKSWRTGVEWSDPVRKLCVCVSPDRCWVGYALTRPSKGAPRFEVVM